MNTTVCLLMSRCTFRQSICFKIYFRMNKMKNKTKNTTFWLGTVITSGGVKLCFIRLLLLKNRCFFVVFFYLCIKNVSYLFFIFLFNLYIYIQFCNRKLKYIYIYIYSPTPSPPKTEWLFPYRKGVELISISH